MGNSGSAHHINIERSGIDRSAHFQTRFQHQTQHSHRQFEWSRSVLRSIPSSPQRSLTTEWRRSYPSALLKKESGSPMESSLKVLPEVDKRLHLRATTNGAILNSGGTISGRKQNENQLQNVSHILSQQSKTFVLETVHDSSSGSNKKTDTRPELTRSQTLLHIKAKQKDSASNMNDSNLFRMQRHTYSEPELINSLNQQAAVTTNMQEQPLRANNRMKYSKKRRAPEVPQAVTATTPLIKNNTEILRNTPSSKSMHYAKNADRKLSKQIPSSVPTQTEPLINRDHGIRKSVNETNCQRNSHERPKFAFRREKSSDAILLRSQRLIQPEIKANSLISKVNDYQRDKNQILDSTFENETSPQKENFDNGVVSVQENKCQRTFYFGMETDVVDIHSIAFGELFSLLKLKHLLTSMKNIFS
ncbi:thioredoxin domain-containing protein 2-like [Drosophila navojoa]|uniref:thioredoxin domain-containing protein 2-like n=1 Tax=Drosophila navojoa TaxID=7232 RepID=UPI0011BF6BE8|nr:thioredoxin domain-containing protein 2-like [Drosophila navojoa]